jgi:hypothetical protein
LRSICARVLISMALVLPQMSPASLSPDSNLHQKLLEMVHKTNAEIGSGTSSVASKTLGLVLRNMASCENSNVSCNIFAVIGI